jgi:hypothetical protein
MKGRSLFEKIYIVILVAAQLAAMVYLVFLFVPPSQNLRHDGVRYRITEEGLSVHRFTSRTTNPDFEVPDEIGGVKVTALGSFSFANAEYLRTLTLGRNITSIDVWALTNNPVLERITVDPRNTVFFDVNGVLFRYITRNADGSPLESELIFYPNLNGSAFTVPDHVVSIRANAFYRCGNLSEITFSQTGNLTSIGDRAFQRCENLQMVRIPEGVTSIGVDAFSFCNNMVGVLILPSTLITASDFAFYSTTTQITEVIIMGVERPIGGRDWLPMNRNTPVPVRFMR